MTQLVDELTEFIHILQLSSQSSQSSQRHLGGGGWRGEEVGVQEMNEQTSDTLEVGNSIIHNVIETGDVGLQSIRLPMTLHIQPKYCIPGLCQPDTRPCKIKIHHLLSIPVGAEMNWNPLL